VLLARSLRTYALIFPRCVFTDRVLDHLVFSSFFFFVLLYTLCARLVPRVRSRGSRIHLSLSLSLSLRTLCPRRRRTRHRLVITSAASVLTVILCDRVFGLAAYLSAPRVQQCEKRRRVTGVSRETRRRPRK